MVTSRNSRRGPAAYLESRKNLTGCTLAIGGLVLYFTGVTGSLWPLVVAGLYGVGALLAPPERPPAPDFPAPEEQLSALRGDLAALRAYLVEAQLESRFSGLLERLAALLDPERGGDVLAGDPEALHALSRTIRQDVPEAVDACLRARWWNRLTPGAEAPERQLDRQAALLTEEADRLVATLREAEERRQHIHTRYLEQRRPWAGDDRPDLSLP
ncbi:hypothetical protein [Peterkaempfera griseoplana]|uniref:hypothetical protein n=1 Tax=Peterkaempfera griseoplana TaxID=66896 RepID=UPI0006E11EF1|nr:hypothetical protein [Peterkaempfera griseoplana]